MLHIVLVILKFIGILLALIIGLIFVLTICVLLVPVRYRFTVRKANDDIYMDGRASWFLRLLSIPVILKDNDFTIKVKLLGIQVMPRKKRKPNRGKSGSSNEKNRTNKLQTQKEEFNKQEHNTETVLNRDTKPNCQKAKEHRVTILEKIRGLKQSIHDILIKIWNIIRNIKETGHKIIAIVRGDEFSQILGMSKKQLIYVYRSIRPSKISGEIHFGTDNPALTGQILGAASIFYPIFRDNIKVFPYFEEERLDVELHIKGYMQLYRFVKVLLILYRDKNLKYIIAEVKKI